MQSNCITGATTGQAHDGENQQPPRMQGQEAVTKGLQPSLTYHMARDSGGLPATQLRPSNGNLASPSELSAVDADGSPTTWGSNKRRYLRIKTPGRSYLVPVDTLSGQLMAGLRTEPTGGGDVTTTAGSDDTAVRAVSVIPAVSADLQMKSANTLKHPELCADFGGTDVEALSSTTQTLPVGKPAITSVNRGRGRPRGRGRGHSRYPSGTSVASEIPSLDDGRTEAVKEVDEPLTLADTSGHQERIKRLKERLKLHEEQLSSIRLRFNQAN
jgi:hypothetical protein